MNISVPRMITPIGSRGNSGWVYGRSFSECPCAMYAVRKRREMSPMLVHTSNAEMPVTLSSHVNAMPSPQIVVRKVRQEKASASLKRASG